MEAISSDVGVVQPNKGRKVMKHLANAGVTTAGLAATALGTGAGLVQLQTAKKYACGSRYWDTLDAKFFRFFSRIGNKLIPENSFDHKRIFRNIFGRKAPNRPHFVRNCMNYAKARIALLLGAGALATSILGAGFYKAGKINGEGK